MPKYRKRPVIVEAFQWNPRDEGGKLIPVCWPGWATSGVLQVVNERGESYMIVHTLEGNMHASPGDWIIRGIKGEVYACKPDIFAASYEEVPDA